MRTNIHVLNALFLLSSTASALHIVESPSTSPPRKAVLLVSGQLRTQSSVCKNQLEMLVKANPNIMFDVFHLSDQKSNEVCVAHLRAEPNVRNVTVLVAEEEAKHLSPEFQKQKEKCRTKVCQPLMKQYILRDKIIKSNMYTDEDLFIHTRFDVTFDSPLYLDKLDYKSKLYVLRSTWFMKHAKGSMDDQKTHPIFWRDRYTLKNSVPDYAFIGSWKHVSVPLKRFELLTQVLNRTSDAKCVCGKSCDKCPEELLQQALAKDGIQFEGSPPVQLLFATPCVEIVRDAKFAEIDDDDEE